MKTLLAAAFLVLALASPAAAARFQIIVLTGSAGPGRVSYQLAFWYDVPAARQPFYAAPKKVSAWSGATAQDNKNLSTGAVFEEVVTYSPDSAQTLDQVEAGAQALWQASNAAFQATNQWANYGSTFDGTTWTIVTVP